MSSKYFTKLEIYRLLVNKIFCLWVRAFPRPNPREDWTIIIVNRSGLKHNNYLKINNLLKIVRCHRKTRIFSLFTINCLS